MYALTETILEGMPFYEAEDPIIQRLVDAQAGEIERVETTAYDILQQFFSLNADDTYGLLAVHEQNLGLPVKPLGVTVAARQNAIAGAVRRRYSPYGTDWRNSVNAALGTTAWEVVPHYPADYDLTILVPWESGTDEFNAVEPLLTPFTPAAYDIIPNDGGEGFVVGVSEVGEEVL
jgi:hypothetical protein